MKMLINRPEAVVEEMVEGLVRLHPGLRRLAGRAVIVRADAASVRDRQVAVISGGGSGHEPAHAGYVGRGMLSAAVAGDVFTSPSPDAVLAAIHAVAGKPGAVLIVKNYTGDRLNFGLAAEMARAEGIPVEVVIVADDVALPESEAIAGPRGLAGTIFVHKVAGAAAESGLGLSFVAEEARRAASSVKTMGVALSPCTVPAAGKPGFTLGEHEIELGLGIHGEPGVRKAPLEPADALVKRLIEAILPRMIGHPGRLSVLVNGLGGTTAMELAIVARSALTYLERAGIVVERVFAGTFLSALEMAGVSISLLNLDDHLLARLDTSTDAPAWPNSPPRSRVEPEIVETTNLEPSREPIPPATDAGRALEITLRRVAEAIISDSSRLNELDRVVGDGDLGVSLARGARAMMDHLPSQPLDDPAATLHALSVRLQNALGGTSGPLYAMGLLRASGRLRDAPGDWSGALRAACEGITELGGATAGDRTMLDALIPAAEALAAAKESGRTPSEALAEAVTAAEAGAKATASMSPRKGRSSYLGRRAIDHPDPGAEAVVVWLRAIGGTNQGKPSVS